jgi:hypothetical protein
MTRQFKWLRLWVRLAGLTSAVLFVSPFTGCRQEVVVAFYSGLEQLVISLVQTYFQAITPTTTTNTAQAVMNSIQTWLT